MQKDQVYKNFKHKMPNVAFLKKVVKESFVMPLDMIQVNFKFTLDNLEQIFKAKLSVVRTMQDKSSSNLNYIQIKPSCNEEITIMDIPVFFKNFNPQIESQLIDRLQPKQLLLSDNFVKELLHYHQFAIQVEASDRANLYHSHIKSQVKISLVDTQFQFVKTDHLQQLLDDPCTKMTNGLLGFDENYRLIVYGPQTAYPVVGLWTKGIDLGNIFLQNQINDTLRQLLWILFMKHARNDTFDKVTFSETKVKFLFVPFSSKASNPPILLVEMGTLKDLVTSEITKISPTHQIEESIPIQQSLQIQKQIKRSTNFKLWDNFLTKTSVNLAATHAPNPTMSILEARMDQLAQEFEGIEKMIQSQCFKDTLKTKVFNHSGQFLEEEYLKSESDVQTSNYPIQFQRLLQQQSSRQLFTGRSLMSNQKNTCVQFAPELNTNALLHSKEAKFSPQKKLKNSIYDTLNQTNKWLSSEGKRLSMGQLSQHEVNSFFADIPQIKSCQ